jgi:hypothetical protein
MESRRSRRFTFLNGQTIMLTTGEVNAIERMVRQNGSDPEAAQYDPGNIHYRTLNNLMAKGILRRSAHNGGIYFVKGYLPVTGSTIFTNRHFDLEKALSNPVLPAPVWDELAAEDFRVGYRYWPVRPGYEKAWTVQSVTVAPAPYEVERDGKLLSPLLVTHVYGDGRERVFEKGERVVVQGPWKTQD